MYNSTLYIHFKETDDNRNILRMFFEDWADKICDDRVRYSVVPSKTKLPAIHKILKLDFESAEDATAMKLLGIPEELRKYVEFVDSSYPTY